MTEEKIPRKKLIKLCRKLQERVKTVEAKHASVVSITHVTSHSNSNSNIHITDHMDIVTINILFSLSL